MATKVTYIKTSSIRRKMFQLLGAVALLMVTLSLWLDINQKGEDLLVENAMVLADNVMQQTAHTARHHIQTGDSDSLDVLVASALTSEHILEMVIYDKAGQVLSQSENALPTVQRFRNLDKTMQGFEPVPFVREVLGDNGSLIGFVRLTILTRNLQQEGMNFVYVLSKQIMLITLLAGLIGYLFTVGLRPFSANAYMVKE